VFDFLRKKLVGGGSSDGQGGQLPIPKFLVPLIGEGVEMKNIIRS